ncbi:putative transposase [Myxococcus xanthus DK 1622]|uniref:Transposase n=1 Tax=Myxococcus xanthus (strain DK1622) TaxID=246197 RepID=Q1DBD8_MYXXD|nr:putative transposase [Myxococcus xanthus DK 1622]
METRRANRSAHFIEQWARLAQWLKLWPWCRREHQCPRGNLVADADEMAQPLLRKTYCCPWQTSYAERVIGSIRRELLDHVVILNEAHARRLLREYKRYYNAS